MNVFIWGPPLWRILHSVAYVMPDNKAVFHTVATNIMTLSHVLPCIHCRKSFRQYVRELGPPTQGNLIRWMYDLHEKVNTKLDEQAMTDCLKGNKRALAAVNASKCVLRGKRLSFECLLKRHKVRPVNVMPQDVFDVLFVLSLNFPHKDTEMYDKKVENYQAFIETFYTVLQVLTLQNKLYTPLHEVASLYNTYRNTPMRNGHEMFTATTMLWCNFYKYMYNKTLQQQLFAKYSVAKASACKHGSCL